MNVNQQVQWDSQYLSNEAASEQSGEENTKGANVTSTPRAITEGLIFDPNQADSSSDTLAKLGKRSASTSRSEIYYCEEKKEKSTVTVFTALPGTTSPRLYIGTIGEVFCIFNNEQCLQEGQPCDVDRSNHITLELSHLTSMNFSKKPAELIYALLTKAMEQTNKAEDVASFFLHPRINKQLSEKTHWLMVRLLNHLTGMLANKDSNFKTELCKCISSEVARSNEKSVSKETLVWLADSLLLESVLLNLKNSKIDIMPITQYLSIGDIRDFSEKRINELLTSEDCFRLFNEACSLELGDIALRLLLTKNCNRLMNISKSENVNALFFFAGNNIVVGVKYLLDNDLVEVNSTDDKGNTPLMTVVKAGYEHCLKVLLGDPNIDVNSLNNGGIVPLCEVLLGGDQGCLELLLGDKNINVNKMNAATMVPLFCAVSGICMSNVTVSCFNEFLGAPGLDLDVQNTKGNTALHEIVEREIGIEYLEALLTVGADVNVQNNDGCTVLHQAVKSQNEAYTSVLLKVGNINVNAVNDGGYTALFYAVYLHEMTAFNTLLKEQSTDVNKADRHGYTPIHAAVSTNNLVALKALLSHPDIEIDLTSKDMKTPLSLALFLGYLAYVEALLSENKININQRIGFERRTLMHYAVMGGSRECLKKLLGNKDIQFNVSDAYGCTPLDLAAEKNNEECLKELLTINDIRKSATKALHRAVKKNSIECFNELLTVEGIDINAWDHNQCTLLLLTIKMDSAECFHALLGEEYIDVNKADKYGRTPLHEAAVRCHRGFLKSLLAMKGIDISKQDNNGCTPLDLLNNGCAPLDTMDTTDYAVCKKALLNHKE